MLIKHSLDATRMFFQVHLHHLSHPPTLLPAPHPLHGCLQSHRRAPEQSGLALDDPLDWNRSSGYFSEPHYGKECYDFRPGATPSHPNPHREAGECSPPDCLPGTLSEHGSTAFQYCSKHVQPCVWQPHMTLYIYHRDCI